MLLEFECVCTIFRCANIILYTYYVKGQPFRFCKEDEKQLQSDCVEDVKILIYLLK